MRFKIPYDTRTENTRIRMIGNRSSYIPNKVYKSAEGEFYFYINTKGYYHILKPCCIKYNGEFSHYEIKNLLLTKDNTLKETSCTGFYKNKTQCIQAIRS